MKILGLIPCLMVDNNREVNSKAMDFFKNSYQVDKIAVCDQEFKPEDYKDGFEYIGRHDKRIGFASARNELLSYFYNSDYDYALWMDANGSFTKTSLNSLLTVLKNLREGTLDFDVCLSTLGIINSGERMADKKRDDYFETATLVPVSGSYRWFHGMIMKNFKKHYNLELYCQGNNFEGVPEDTYFVMLLRRYFTTYLCSDLTVSKPSNNASTWMNSKDSYAYPPTDFKKIDRMIEEAVPPGQRKIREFSNVVYLERVEEHKDELKSFVSRKKKQEYELF